MPDCSNQVWNWNMASTLTSIRSKHSQQWRITSSGMLHRMALVRTDVSEERSASIIRVTRIGELGTTLALPSNGHKLRKNKSSFETSVLTRATRRNSPEVAILHSHRREDLKSYTSHNAHNIYLLKTLETCRCILLFNAQICHRSGAIIGFYQRCH
jgi:hypothetical protein